MNKTFFRNIGSLIQLKIILWESSVIAQMKQTTGEVFD